MKRILAAFFLLAAFTMYAQNGEGDPEDKADGTPAAVPFPILPLLQTAAGNAPVWRPDWPFDAPPDLFDVSGGAVSITVKFTPPPNADDAAANGASAADAKAAPDDKAVTDDKAADDDKAPAPAVPLTELRFAADGTSFPALVHGDFVQVDTEDFASSFTVKTPSGGWAFTRPAAAGPYETWEAKFTANAPAQDVPAQDAPSDDASAAGKAPVGKSSSVASAADTPAAAPAIFYVVLSAAGLPDRTETWYGEYGAAAAFFDGEQGERLDWDSRGNIVGVESAAGTFTALYGFNNRPRYRDITPAASPPVSLSLQWDERGILIGVSGTVAGAPVEYRYEYDFDAHGNWVTRRAYAMVQTLGGLFPMPAGIVTRTIEYAAAEAD